MTLQNTTSVQVRKLLLRPGPALLMMSHSRTRTDVEQWGGSDQTKLGERRLRPKGPPS